MRFICPPKNTEYSMAFYARFVKTETHGRKCTNVSTVSCVVVLAEKNAHHRVSILLFLRQGKQITSAVLLVVVFSRSPFSTLLVQQVKTIMSVLLREYDIEVVGELPQTDFEAMLAGPKGKCMVRYAKKTAC